MLLVPDICNLYAYLYTKLPAPSGTWDYVLSTDGCWVAIKRVDGIDYVMFRGSVTFRDWIEDFHVVALPFDDPHLGWVHNGFRDGVLSNIGWINNLVGPHVVIVGHSLGAGHALLYAGYRICDGLPVDELVLFGSPRAGGPKLTSVLSKTMIRSYRNMDANGHDQVTDVPYNISLPFVGGIQYEQPRALLDVSASPKADDHWGPFRWHHFSLYSQALGASGPAVVAITIL